MPYMCVYMLVRVGPAPLHTWKGQGHAEYLCCAQCNYSRNLIRLQPKPCVDDESISVMVQDDKYLDKRNCFHKAANWAAKALRYDHKESK